MEVQQLFDELKKETLNQESVFGESGIINCFDKMEYGFFPLGLGILSKTIKSKGDKIEENGVMILGNDFGTVSYIKNIKYVENSHVDKGETNSKTIINLLNKFGLDIERTFFTNFYLGVRRDDGPYEGTTMTKRVFEKKVNKLKEGYKELCYNFFIKQLEFINPSIVICLGHDVKNALVEAKLFPEWKKSDSIKKLYAENRYSRKDKKLGDVTFVVISHPCDLRNFKQEHIDILVRDKLLISSSVKSN
jgi:hypothetical protein